MYFITIQFSHLSPESYIACHNDGLLAAEVGNVIHDLLCVGVSHCLAQMLLALEVQNRSYAVLVVWCQLNNAERVKTLRSPYALGEWHVCGVVVVEVELCTVLARVEDDYLGAVV